MLRKMDMVKKDFSSVLGYEKMQKFNEFHVSKIKIKYIGIYIRFHVWSDKRIGI